MTEKTIMGKYCNKKQEIFLKDLAEAILEYSKNKKGEVLIDDFKTDLFLSKNEWYKMSFYFKVKE